MSEVINTEIPLIYTTKGNLPVADLEYSTAWEITDDYIKFIETHKLGEEIVKQSSHLYLKKPLDLAAIQGLIG